MSKSVKTKPVPVRFDVPEDKFLRRASFETGLSMSDLLRRSVRLMRRQSKMMRGYGFILDLGNG